MSPETTGKRERAGAAEGASAPDAAAPEADETHRQCMPCRGTGRVISNLGGKRSEVSCPWCGGSGARQTGIDAQARWLDAPDAGAAGADADAEADAEADAAASKTAAGEP